MTSVAALRQELYGPSTRRRTLRQLPRFLAASWRLVRSTSPRDFAISVVIQLGVGLASGGLLIAGREALSGVLDADRGSGDLQSVAPALLAAALLGVAIKAATLLQSEREELLAGTVGQAARNEVLDAVAGVELSAFDDPVFYDRFMRADMGAEGRPYQLVQALLGFIQGSVAVVAVGAALFTMGPLFVPLVALTAVPAVIARRKSSQELDVHYWEMAPIIRERERLRQLLSGRDEAKEVRAFGLAGSLLRRHHGLADTYLSAKRRLAKQRVRRSLLANAASALLAGVVALVLVVMVTTDRMDSAAAAVAAGGIYLLMTRLDTLAASVASLYESAVFLDDFHGFIESAKAELRREPPAVPLAAFSRLDAQDVVFQYPGTDTPALRGASLSIGRGEVVALVGENGSGKTTLAKLLAHLYRPSGGRVLWDGLDTATLPAQSVLSQVAVIFQDFIRYPLSAYDNITLGCVDRADDREAAVAASRRAGADGFLSQLPDGYDTILSKEFVGGTDLSLGQWQRVALARALFRDAPFLILDEPTASLDPRAEQALFDSLREVCAGRSVLLISHRFSTVRSADRIYVMKDGQIIEHGSHEQLMAEDGLYAELFTIQASAYLDTERGGVTG